MVLMCFTQLFLCSWFCSRLLLIPISTCIPMCEYTCINSVYFIVRYTCNVVVLLSVVVVYLVQHSMLVSLFHSSSSTCSIGSSTLSSCALLSAKTVEIKVTKTPLGNCPLWFGLGDRTQTNVGVRDFFSALMVFCLQTVPYMVQVVTSVSTSGDQST